MNEEDLKSALSGMAGWSGDTSAIRRTVEFSDFPAAIRAVVAVAEVAEDLDHHPDIDIRWRTVTFTLSTHSAGGVTEQDLDLARRIDGIAGTVA